MENKYLSRMAMLFVVALVGSFAYLYIKQNFLPKPPSQPSRNSNQSQVVLTGTNTVGASPIKKFASAEEFETFLAENSSSAGYYGGPLIRRDSAVGMPAPSGIDFPEEFAGFSDQGMKADGLGGGGDDYSRTNIQVQGVDEADIVKTDGKYIYAVSQNNLFLIEAYPAGDAKILSKIEFKSQPQNVYLNGDRLIVFGYNTQVYESDFYMRIRPQAQFTFFKIFDISDRKNPKQLRNLDFEGAYLNSRMIGDHVYLLTSQYSYNAPDQPMPLPQIIENGDTLLNDPKAPGYVFPDVYYFDIPYQGYSLTSVHAINVKDSGAKPNTDTYVVDPNQQLYVSPGALYLTYTKRVSEEMLAYEVVKDFLLPKLPERDRERIAEIEKIPNYILSPQEKFAKITQMLERYQASLSADERKSLEQELTERIKAKYDEIQKQIEKTIVHKITIDTGDLTYKGFGEVPGYVLNQYSMDEHDGTFRIATTKSRSWSQFDEERGASYSNVYVLDGDLKIMGSVEELAKGEQIFSARFMGSRVYLVTFRQTDPFFTIDLSDPRNPKVLGELKIPGFSNYLHPYDDTTVIGLGKETEENQYGGVTTKGVKVSLFDVSDVTKPKEIAKYVVSDPSSNSLALQDPKAFLFSKDKELLVIPVTTYGSGLEPMLLPGPATRGIIPPRRYFNGVYVFKITKNAIELKGTVVHDNASAGQTITKPGYYYSPEVKRSMYIKEILYTLSDVRIRMNALDDLSDVKNLELKKEASGDDDFIIVN